MPIFAQTHYFWSSLLKRIYRKGSYNHDPCVTVVFGIWTSAGYGNEGNDRLYCSIAAMRSHLTGSKKGNAEIPLVSP